MGFDFTNLVSWQNGVALLLSGIQITCYLMAGNKNRWGWIVGLTGALPWCVVMIAWGAWGLLPLVVFLQVIYVVNFIKWTRDEQQSRGVCGRWVDDVFRCTEPEDHKGECAP